MFDTLNSFKQCLGLQFAINLALILVGALYINDCEARPGVPYFLILTGCLGAFSVFFGLARPRLGHPSYGLSIILEGVFYMLSTMLIAMGTFAIYKLTLPTDEKGPHQCNAFLFWFTFAYILIYWVFLILLFIVCLALALKRIADYRR